MWFLPENNLRLVLWVVVQLEVIIYKLNVNVCNVKLALGPTK